MSDAEGHQILWGEPTAFAMSLLEDHSVEVARQMLGALLVRRERDSSETIVRVVETEAYRQDDPASHSSRGRTPRTEVMFGPAGHAYVYFTYGMHWCMNVTTESRGTGAAVLLRAAVCLQGCRRVRSRRGPKPTDRDLLRGPARLTSGLGIDGDHNGINLLEAGSSIRLARDGWRPGREVVRSGPRIGVRDAPDQPWRFWIDGVPEVSRYVRHQLAPPAPA